MKNKAKELLEQYEKDGNYPKMKKELLILFDISNRFYVGFDGETEIISSNDKPLTKENAPRIEGYEIESEREGIITYKPKLPLMSKAKSRFFYGFLGCVSIILK